MTDDEHSEDLDATEHLPESSDASQRIGRYVLRQAIGEGGMGEVWLAEQQEPIKRQVALKVIKQGMDTKQVVARFEAERQALAMMDHPAIAKIYDAGTTSSGRPYFVMEYVKGVPVTRYCDTKRLALVQRLELFCAICDGVQHAHNKAVIHRDLKPSNILVVDAGGTPQPKIIDFGVAKAVSSRLTEKTMFTEFGQLLGTPEYMSPEQAELTTEDVDTRSDIYALGVILYQLLVGSLPFESDTLRKGGFDGIRRLIREVDPPTPSTRLTELGDRIEEIASCRKSKADQLRRALRGDLDWVVMKALEKDRNRRYPTANGLAADVRRYLTDEPVTARPPDRLYRLQKLVRRNKATFVTMSVIFASLIVGVTMTFWGMMRATRAEQHAAQEAKTSQTVNDFLNNDLLAAVAPSAREGRGREVSMREVLDVAAKKIDEDEEARARFAEMPAVEAAIRTTIGITYMRLGEYAAAEPFLERTLRIRESHPGRDNLDLAAALGDMGGLQERLGRYEQAEGLWKKAIELRKAARGEQDPTTISWMTNLARIIGKQARPAEAEPLLLHVLDLQQSTLGEQDVRTLATMGSLANFYQELGRNEEAESLQVRVLEIRKRYFGEEDPDTVGSMNNLANVYASQGRLEKAISLYTRTLELKRKLYGDEHSSTLNTWNNMAEVQEVLGNYETAESLHRDVLAARTRALGAEHPQTLYSGARLAYVLMKLGHLDEAERRASRVCAAYEATLGPTHSFTLAAADVLGMILLRQGRVDEAERVLRSANETLAKEHADNMYYRSLVGAHLGLVLAERDRVEEARTLWNEVADDLPAGDAETTSILRQIVDHFERWNEQDPGRYGEPLALWREKLAASHRN